MTELTLREIEVNTQAHRDEIQLRLDVLRAPLGLTFSSEALQREHMYHHLGLFEGETLVACVMMEPLPETSMRMLELAVREEKQRAGRGRNLVGFAERFALEKGYSRVHMHARETAVPFHLKMGYQIEGERFIEFTIPFFRMTKLLRQ